MTSSLELMRIHVEAGYVHDDSGDLLRINDWIGAIAPRFWLGVTPEGVLWRCRHDVPADVRADIESLCREEPRCEPRRSTPRHDVHYRHLLGGERRLEVVAGPTYRFARPVTSGSEATRIDAKNANLLRGGLEAWLPDVPHQQPFFASIASGKAVSVCASVRVTGVAHAAGVETLPEFRGRGHAIIAVTAWARAVQSLGRIALYSTSWDNRASQAVAARLGLEAFGQEYRIS